MGRELAITLYLWFFQIVFSLFRLYPLKKQSTFVASFGDNVLYTADALEKAKPDVPIIILKTSSCKLDFAGYPDWIILNFEPTSPIHWLRSVFHLATSSHIFVDNYFGFLAAAPFRKEVACVQLWHAAGAVKKFGLKDPSIYYRTPRAQARFQKVYHQHTHVVVGSEKMSEIFQQSFGIPAERILKTGIPRTDFFYDELTQQIVESDLAYHYPVIRKKQVMLYAPTFRDDQMHISQLALDLEKMYQAFHKDYVLFLRLHPAIQADWTNHYPDFIYNVSHYPDVNHLLMVTDLLISDYSSIPFEFSLLQRPMFFFAYDLEAYSRARGFWENYESLVPGPIVQTTDELIESIQNQDFHLQQIDEFAQNWNEYSQGNSSEQLVQALFTSSEQTSHSRSIEE
ncbi:CDP-glycerol glycerophosphotransferase family protein [Bacillus sp. SD088]|uniref:CDP-glycerol glycerophosphotransferase family protein n=1 Tax=Bacillus sp. SD088 TaxID=2782012 RepID=UPI001A9698BE|nr:CDP-glycerol glycerophosphotransferase family protein [Bacillus sp. SD088]MBO0991483.1 CDP-glycerol glycerophosphotransferase family protein [Bacillus sp. SD088]